MDQQETNATSPVITVGKILGYVLLTPPLLSVIFFLISVFKEYDSNDRVIQLRNLSRSWTGGSGDYGGYTSAAPFYFGLMAIAGAILISRGTKK